jgi:NAD(P)H-dependent FMN reductase
MYHLQVIIASTRPNRKGPRVAEWFMTQAEKSPQFTVELVDLAEIDLPLLDEPRHPRLEDYAHAHTRRWSATVSRADAYIFVLPEYDFGTPAALANALQYLVHEWAYKPVGFVSYGGVSAGLRSVEMTKQTVTALNMMPIPQAVSIPFFSRYLQDDGTDDGGFDPGEVQEKAAVVMLAELAKWAGALQPLRQEETE